MDDEKYEFLRVRREFRHPFVTGAGRFDYVERILIRTEVNGIFGFGEVAPWPNFKTESISLCLELLKSTGGDLNKLKVLYNKSKGSFPCLGAALSSCSHWSEIQKLDKKTACAGLITQPSEKTVYEKLSLGFKTLKIKITPETSLSEIKSIISASPKDIIFRFDANGSLNLDQTKPWVNFALSSEKIEFIEQPLPVNDSGYNYLDPHKVALDESFVGLHDSKWSGPIIAKPCIVGDWKEFLDWRQSRHNSVYYSSVFETAFGRQAALWLAQQDSQTSAVGFDTLNYFKDDGLDHHKPGPIIEGLANFDWLELWRSIQ